MSLLYPTKVLLKDLAVGDVKPEQARFRADLAAMDAQLDRERAGDDRVSVTDHEVEVLLQDDPVYVAGTLHWLLSGDSVPVTKGDTARFLHAVRELVRAGKPLTVPQVRSVFNCHRAWVKRHFEPFPATVPSVAPGAKPVVALAKGLDLRTVPSGWYVAPGTDGPFLRVDNVTEGKWAGWVFVKDGARYSVEETRFGACRPRQPYVGRHAEELRAVVEDPQAAAARYGVLTGVCGRCGRALEDPESVRAGLGPTCRKAMW